MKDRQFKQILEELGDRAVSVGHDPWPAISECVLERRAVRGRRSYRFSPPQRLGTVLAALVMALVLGGAGYYAIPALERAFNMDSGTSAILTGRLGEEVGVSKTVGGLTLTVQRAYADANRIVVGYTVSGPKGRDIIDYDAHGRPTGSMPTLTSSDGVRHAPGRGTWGSGVEEEVGAGVLLYDGAGVVTGGADARFRLVVPAVQVMERVGEVDRGEAHRIRASGACDERSRPARCYVVRGPFVFDLAIPVQPSRVAEPRESVVAGGERVVLERVVVSPTETRVYLRGVRDFPNAELSVGDWNSALETEGTSEAWEEGGLTVYSFPASLVDERGEWTLTVGLHTFRFVVP